MHYVIIIIDDAIEVYYTVYTLHGTHKYYIIIIIIYIIILYNNTRHKNIII